MDMFNGVKVTSILILGTIGPFMWEQGREVHFSEANRE